MDSVGFVLAGIPTTLLVTVGALAIGAVGMLPLAILRVSRVRLIRAIAIFTIDIVRGIPPIVWLFIIFFGLGTNVIHLSPLTASIVGLGVISAAYFAEILRGGINSVDRGQREAAAALGISPFHGFALIVLPQAIRSALPAAATFSIGLLKDSSIASTIGAPEVLYRAGVDAGASFEPLMSYGIAAGFYLVVSLIAAWATRRLDAHFRRAVS